MKNDNAITRKLTWLTKVELKSSHRQEVMQHQCLNIVFIYSVI